MLKVPLEMPAPAAVPSVQIIRAVLREYHAGTHTAEVEPVLGPASLVGEIPVLMSCRPDLLTTGRTVAVLVWSDVGGLVLGPYGAVPEDPPYVCVRDKKALGTKGGTFTSGAWRTRDINDEQADTAGICSLASNQITLAAGSYRCMISCPSHRVRRHQTRLYNITDAAVLLLGTGEYARDDTYGTTRSFVVGRFILVAQKTLEVQHRCEVTRANDGFGVQQNFTDEIYTVAEFWREA